MTIAERYTLATSASALKTGRADQLTDADILLAAGYASSGDPRKAVALDFYRLRANGAGFRRLVEESAGWLKGRAARRGRLLKRTEALDTAASALRYWVNSRCNACDGHGHPLIPGAPSLDETRDCGDCGGTGQRPLHLAIRGDQDEARWLMAEVDKLTAMVFSDMLRLTKVEI